MEAADAVCPMVCAMFGNRSIFPFHNWVCNSSINALLQNPIPKLGVQIPLESCRLQAMYSPITVKNYLCYRVNLLFNIIYTSIEFVKNVYTIQWLW